MHKMDDVAYHVRRPKHPQQGSSAFIDISLNSDDLLPLPEIRLEKPQYRAGTCVNHQSSLCTVLIPSKKTRNAAHLFNCCAAKSFPNIIQGCWSGINNNINNNNNNNNTTNNKNNNNNNNEHFVGWCDATWTSKVIIFGPWLPRNNFTAPVWESTNFMMDLVLSQGGSSKKWDESGEWCDHGTST